MSQTSAIPSRRRPLLIVPGIYGSGAEHWQTIWQERSADSVRLEVPDWDHPVLAEWIAGFERALDACWAPPVVVAHSLGCLLTVGWAGPDRAAPGKTEGRIAGAFLVAPPNPESSRFPAEATTFRGVVAGPLGYPCVVVASTDDHYGDADSARRLAETLEGGFVSIGAYGHINSQSDIGDWKEGLDLLECFAAGLGVRI